MTYYELIERAVSAATAGMTADQLSVFPAEMLAEDLAPVVFSTVSGECAGDPYKRGWLRRAYTLTFSNGNSVLPDTVLSDYLIESVMFDPNNLAALYSYQPDRQLFQIDHDNRLGRYHIDETTVWLVQPGEDFAWGTGFSGDLNFSSPSEVVVPDTLDGFISARSEVVSLLQIRLTAALQKEVPGARP